MSEIAKCPVCRSDGRKERGREDGEYVAYYVCDTCMFMCGLEDLPRIVAAMELAEKKHGCLFPEEEGGTYYVRLNATLHIEKFAVRPLSEKKVPEAKKDCKIIR